ncbi:MAG: flagellar M-ring protein FliF C-terminal domain-containing protein, partial [Rhodospirillales bacterium]
MDEAVRHFLGTMRPGRLGALGSMGLALLLAFAVFAACDDALGADPAQLPSPAVLNQARADLEHRLGRAVEELLEPLVGAGRVRAEVSAELDPERVSVSSEVVDPDSQVQRTVRAIEEGNKSDVTTTYEFSRTAKSLVREAGALKRLSVAVLVDFVHADGKPAPRGPEEMETLARLVRSAIGFNPERGDKVEFVSMRFTDFPPRGPRTGLPLGLSRAELARLGEILILCLAGLLGLLVVARAFKQRRPAMAAASPAPPQAAPVQSPVAPAAPAQPSPPPPREARRRGDVWDKLTDVHEATLANYLAQEHPQTVSLVLSRLDPVHAARVLAALPEALSVEVVQRMLRLEPVQPAVMEAVERALSAEFAQSLARAPDGGADAPATVARILDKLDRATERRIVAALERDSRGGAERVKQRM